MQDCLVVASNGVVNLMSSLGLKGPMSNAGTVNLSLSGSFTILNADTPSDQGLAVNLPGGRILIANNTTISGGGTSQDCFINQGQIVKTAGTGTSLISVHRFDTSAGSVEAQAGTLRVGDFVGTLAGTFNAAAGTILQFTGGTDLAHPVQQGAPLVLGGAGQYQFYSGFLNYPLDLIPKLVHAGGTLTLGPAFQGGTITNLALNGTDLLGTNALTGNLVASNSVFFGTLTITNGGVLTSYGVNYTGLNLASRVTIGSGGTLNVVGGYTYFNASATTSVQDCLVVANNGVLNLHSALQLNGPLTNAGTINLYLAGASAITINNNGTAANQGLLVNLPGGLIEFWRNTTLSGENSARLVNQGQIRRRVTSGTCTLDVVQLVNQGTLTALHGLLQVNHATLDPSGTLESGLSSRTDAGQIALAAGIPLAGTCMATLWDGYQPETGDQFSLVTYPALSGQFASLILPTSAYWQSRYLSTALKVLAGVPRFGQRTRSGTNWVLHAYGGLNGNSYRILTSTDLGAPRDTWTPIWTNVFDSNNHFSFTFNADPAVPQQFYVFELQ